MTVPAKSAEFAKSYPRSICACGHSGDGANSYHAGAGPVAGHGHCLMGSCSCRKFTWAGWSRNYEAFLERGGKR